MNWQELVTQRSTSLAGYYAILCAWMGGAVLSARISRLRADLVPWVNLLSLVAGPVGWLVHLGSHIAVWLSGMSRKGAAGGYGNTAYGILSAALERGASDIHIEPQEGGYVVRFRLFGLLREHKRLTQAGGEGIAAVYKVLAELNTSDRAHMQDGRFRWTHPDSGHVLDVRISTSPALTGEKIALRLLNRPASLLRLDKIGISAAACEAIRRHLRQPEGLVLVAGPTGSGKTSTSYALLQEVSGPSVNTVTIEDPVEYALPHATQIGINPKMGVTFESGLRTVLRQDPNIIFVGEMRDPESFKIGVRAAMSGHLVVSTMHARDTISALTALRNLDIDRQVMAAALRLIVSQRLVRELCPHCRTFAPPDADATEFFRTNPLAVLPPDAGASRPSVPSGPPGSLVLRMPRKDNAAGDGAANGGADGAGVHTAYPLPDALAMPSAQGCPQCHQGFVGRTGIFEVLRVDSRVRQWITSGEPEQKLRADLAAAGFVFMRDDACRKITEGRVWIDDAIRALGMHEG
ncbi:GspE/PulE family protein [Geminisphaera colitermitum]|uniref:GspE/PulE family protein n=1 Tax=Geminisphaera colitermitum TaxID=1148786 RepID=UPI000158D47D|nr:GspE/PulE family protein [Geminisphaera colitermitum]